LFPGFGDVPRIWRCSQDFQMFLGFGDVHRISRCSQDLQVFTGPEGFSENLKVFERSSRFSEAT
jgi:hypothetical protein